MLKHINPPRDTVGVLALLSGIAVMIPSMIVLAVSLFAVAAEIF